MKSFGLRLEDLVSTFKRKLKPMMKNHWNSLAVSPIGRATIYKTRDDLIWGDIWFEQKSTTLISYFLVKTSLNNLESFHKNDCTFVSKLQQILYVANQLCLLLQWTRNRNTVPLKTQWKWANDDLYKAFSAILNWFIMFREVSEIFHMRHIFVNDIVDMKNIWQKLVSTIDALLK